MPMSRCVLLGPPAAPSAGNGISMLQKITGLRLSSTPKPAIVAAWLGSRVYTRFKGLQGSRAEGLGERFPAWVLDFIFWDLLAAPPKPTFSTGIDCAVLIFSFSRYRYCRGRDRSIVFGSGFRMYSV